MFQFQFYLLVIAIQQCVFAELPIVRVQPKGSATEIQISTEAGLELHQKWMQQAFSGLFSAVASKHMKTLSDENLVELEECTKHASDVIRHARCLQTMFQHRDAVKKTEKVGDNWIGGFRVKRKAGMDIKQATNYGLLSKYSGLSPIGSVAYAVNKAIASQKNKTSLTSWQETVENVRRAALERKAARSEMSKKIEEDKSVNNMELLAFRTLDRTQNKEFEDAIDHPERLLKIAKDKKSEREDDPVDKLTNLVKDGVKLGFRLANSNVTEKELDEKTLKLISPRFLSVLPDNETDTLNFISPSLFSLHNKGSGVENLTSLPTLTNEFSPKDQNEWLTLIMEAAGIEDQTKNLEHQTNEIRKFKHLENYEEEVRDKSGQPLYFTKKNVTDIYGDKEKQKIETFERLISSYTPEQMREMNSTGYTIMNKRQLRMLYGEEGSPYHHNETYYRLSRMSKKFIHGRIEEDIKAIAQMDNFEMKQKDIVLSPIFFSPLIGVPNAISNLFIVLSPLVFSVRLI